MLTERLPQEESGTRTTYGELFESFALTYLSQYSSETMQPRVFTAYQNSYGMTNIVNYPRVVGGRPGYLIAYYSDAPQKKVVVAIEGTTSASQLAAWNRNPGSLTLTGTFGRIHAPFVNHANTILTELRANTAFWGFSQGSDVQIIFTGFSLGAAVAELCAEQLKTEAPAKFICVNKFGSPRVGNARYRDNLRSDVRRWNVYCNDDPIHIFPQFANHNMISGWDSVGVPFTYFVPDVECTRYTRNGDEHGGFSGLTVATSIYYAGKFFQTINPQNPWYDHALNTYRLMMSNFCWNGNELIKARFLSLEHNNENSWQVNFRPSATVQTSFLQLITPAPDPIYPPNMNVAPILIPGTIRPRIQVQAEPAGTGGGDWGEPVNVQPISRFRRNR